MISFHFVSMTFVKLSKDLQNISVISKDQLVATRLAFGSKLANTPSIEERVPKISFRSRIVGAGRTYHL